MQKKEGFAEITKDGTTYKYGIPDPDGYPGNIKNWEWKHWEVNPVDAFKRLWTLINGKRSWEDNPWVWVVEFERIDKPAGF